MERDTNLSSSIDSKTRKKILSAWKEESDTFTVEPRAMEWTDLSKGGAFQYPHGRDLSMRDAQEAIKYITAIVSKYPVQIRYAMAKPLWYRFAQAYCETGDLKKALRGI